MWLPIMGSGDINFIRRAVCFQRRMWDAQKRRRRTLPVQTSIRKSDDLTHLEIHGFNEIGRGCVN